MKYLFLFLLALIVCVLASAGCGPTQAVGDTPDSQMNPALTAHQKALRSGAAKNTGG